MSFLMEIGPVPMYYHVEKYLKSLDAKRAIRQIWKIQTLVSSESAMSAEFNGADLFCQNALSATENSIRNRRILAKRAKRHMTFIS